MLRFFTWATVAISTTILYFYVRLARHISFTGGVPRVGKPGVLGYISTALRCTVNIFDTILEGRLEFRGRPFIIPTLSGPVFLLPPEYLAQVRSCTDEVLSEIMAVNEDLQLPYTMDAHQLTNPYQASVLRTDVNRALSSFIPEILDETQLAIEETFKPSTNTEFHGVQVFDTMTHLIARISNRAIFGLALCRDEGFLNAVIRFAETVTVIAPFIQWSPSFLRPLVYMVLSTLVGGKKAALKYLLPYLRKYLKERELMDEKLILVSEYLINSAPPQETVEGLAIRLLNLNFGSIHTSSIFITQALLEIALLSPEDMNSVRTEVLEALESEGGWTRSALLRFRKIDSALREVGRIYGLMHFALPRITLVGFDLGDGTHVPPGYKVAIDMKAIHFNPEVYPNPERCDLFRFSNLRLNEPEANAKYGFATVDNHYLPFGAGRHACAGRFFAAMELKIMLAHIILNYDISYPQGIQGRPKNLEFNGAVIPDPKACLVFTPRQAK